MVVEVEKGGLEKVMRRGFRVRKGICMFVWDGGLCLLFVVVSIGF